jgi:polyisoprenoid-binding protein YceI
MTDVTTQSTDLTTIPAGTYVIDPSHTEVGFVARHAMVTKVRGYFRDVEGTIAVAEDVTASTATATMKVASVDTGNADRDGHLTSGDFFDAEQFPEITFVSTGLSNVSGNSFELAGDLTILGVTKPVVLEAEYEGTAQDPFGNLRAGFSASTVVEREDWGLSWNAALETGGVLVSKKVTLNLEISAIKQA